MLILWSVLKSLQHLETKYLRFWDEVSLICSRRYLIRYLLTKISAIIVWICWSLLTWSLSSSTALSSRLIIPPSRYTNKYSYVQQLRLNAGTQQQKPMIWHSLKLGSKKWIKLYDIHPKPIRSMFPWALSTQTTGWSALHWIRSCLPPNFLQ